MRTGLLPVLLTLFITVTALAQNPQTIDEIANSSQWLKLLHYHQGQSEVDDPRFFAAAEGKKSSVAELKEILTNYESQKYHCRFPARLKYLQEKMSLKVNWQECSEFLQWKQSLKPESISLVFASFYPENPASAFGHLLLKINQDPKHGLLDYSINFSAETGEDKGVMYAWKGLVGKYKGIFHLEKYYIKVKEYKHHEARDLWEYRLPLDSVMLDRFIDHLWEILYSASFDYYFLNQNCSYQIVKLLDVVAPDDSLHHKLLYHNPSDDLERIIETFKADEPIFRPSLYHQTKVDLDLMSRKDYRVLKKVIRHRRSIETVDEPSVLLGVNDFLNFKKESMRNATEKDEELHYKVLVKISQSNLKKENQDFKDYYNPPHRAHHSKRAQASVIQARDQMAYSLRHRFALHNFMDNDAGYLINSNLNLLDVEARYFQKDNIFKITELIFLETQTFTPLSIMRTKPSWSLDFSYRSPFELRCNYCGLTQAKVGRGLTVEAIHNKVFVWGFLNAYTQFLTEKQTFVDRFRYGPQLEMGIVWRISHSFKWLLKIHENFNFVEQYANESVIGETNLLYSLSQNLSFNLTSKNVLSTNTLQVDTNREHQLSFNYFY